MISGRDERKREEGLKLGRQQVGRRAKKKGGEKKRGRTREKYILCYDSKGPS